MKHEVFLVCVCAVFFVSIVVIVDVVQKVKINPEDCGVSKESEINVEVSLDDLVSILSKSISRNADQIPETESTETVSESKSNSSAPAENGRSTGNQRERRCKSLLCAIYGSQTRVDRQPWHIHPGRKKRSPGPNPEQHHSVSGHPEHREHGTEPERPIQLTFNQYFNISGNFYQQNFGGDSHEFGEERSHLGEEVPRPGQSHVSGTRNQYETSGFQNTGHIRETAFPNFGSNNPGGAIMERDGQYPRQAVDGVLDSAQRYYNRGRTSGERYREGERPEYPDRDQPDSYQNK